MSTTPKTLNTPDRFEIERINCTAKLPAALWRALSVAERPAYSPFGETISVVVVDDASTPAVAMPARHYDTLVHRLRELEAWLGECLEEGETA